MTSVLFVITAATGWTLRDGTVHPTGYWAEELIAPHRAFQGAGWDIHFATPGAKAPVVDEYSLEVLPDNVRMAQENYLAELGVALENPMNLADVNEEDYDLIFYPGGHGPMEDLAYDQDSAKLLQARMDSGRALGLGELKFSGQVLPHARKVVYNIDIKRVMRSKLVLGIADGWLSMDDEIIYRAKDLKVGLFKQGTAPS